MYTAISIDLADVELGSSISEIRVSAKNFSNPPMQTNPDVASCDHVARNDSQMTGKPSESTETCIDNPQHSNRAITGHIADDSLELIELCGGWRCSSITTRLALAIA
jgi:hypothetical protein